MYSKIIKPILDFLVSLLILLLIFPLMIFLFILIFIILRGYPIFYQKRPGLNGKIFTLYKFKTMIDKKDSSGKLLPDYKRIFPVGSILRKLSLDELPQLFNVIKGDMSLIGPRPLLVQYLPLYNEFQKRRHEVKPGITGLAQVNGRNAIGWQKKFEFDVLYVDNLSFCLDLKIFWLSILKVFKSEGINQEGIATMETFNGN